MIRIALFLLPLYFFAGCNKKNEVSPPKLNEVPNNVFIAGTVYDKSMQFSTATYWNDGNSNSLPNSDNQSVAMAIEVVGNDEYVAGHENFNAKIWKNGVGSLLPGGDYTILSDIVVQGEDVYVCGTRYDSIAPIYKPVYWKNGTRIFLGPTGTRGFASAMAILGNDVFVVGNDSNYATYWLNGLPTRISDGKKPENINALFIVGQNVYLAGNEAAANGNFIAKYWINGKPFLLSDSTKNNVITGMYVDVNDVYVCGTEYLKGGKKVAVFWKNGIRQDLDGVSANAIIVKGTDVFIVGQSNISEAVLWKNGLPSILRKNYYGAANSIFIK